MVSLGFYAKSLSNINQSVNFKRGFQRIFKSNIQKFFANIPIHRLTSKGVSPRATASTTGAEKENNMTEETSSSCMPKPPPYRGESKNGMTKLTLAGHEIEAISVGGQETCILLPGMKIAFDIGRCPPPAVQQDYFLITHAHLDHLVNSAFLH